MKEICLYMNYMHVCVGDWAREDLRVCISMLCMRMHGALHSLAGSHNSNRDGNLISQMSRRLALYFCM